MSFAGFELSAESGQPLELFEFVLGGDTFAFTNTEDEQMFSGTTYVPAAISRSPISIGSEQRTEVLVVEMEATQPFARKFINIVPGAQASCTISRVHRTDSGQEVVVFFKGIVRSVGFTSDGIKAQIAVLPLSRGMSKSVPIFLYANLCNHVLYDVRCKVVADSFRHTGTVLSVNGNVYTISGLAGSPADVAPGGTQGGFVRIGNTDWRLILSQNGDDVTLLLPFNLTDVDAGTSVDVFAGCDHSISTCSSKFSNVPNYGGYAFVPTKNPFETGL